MVRLVAVPGQAKKHFSAPGERTSIARRSRAPTVFDGSQNQQLIGH
jgi:hypothetical protein